MFCPEWKLKNPNTEKLIGQFFPNKNHLKSTVRDLTQFRCHFGILVVFSHELEGGGSNKISVD